MPELPPLLAEEALVRVLRRARSNGTLMLVIGSTFALMGAVAGAYAPVAAWLLVAGTGALTLHGAGLLTEGEPRGIPWLIAGQLLCLAFVVALCAWQLTHVDLEPLRIAMDAKMQETVKQTGLTDDEFLLLSYRLTYAFIAFVSLIFQGGMTIYYLNRRSAVLAALEEESSA